MFIRKLKTLLSRKLLAIVKGHGGSAEGFDTIYTKKYGIQLTGEVVQCEREPLNVADRYAADRY